MEDMQAKHEAPKWTHAAAAAKGEGAMQCNT